MVAGRHYALTVAEIAWRILAESGGGLQNIVSGFKQRVLERLLGEDAGLSGIVRGNIRRVVEAYYGPLLEGLERLGLSYVDAKYRLDSKLLVGASSGIFAAVFEVGLSWDMLFDLPYIPGSSLKGLLRGWALARCAEQSSQKDRRRCAELVFLLFGASRGQLAGRSEENWFRSVFGAVPVAAEAWAGLVALYDAYPVASGSGSLASGLLEADVVTPHYYRGGNPVSDELGATPVPVPHVVVAPGTVFRIVASLEGTEAEEAAKELAGLTLRHSGDGVSGLARMLDEALRWGIGARTGRGYGHAERAGDPALKLFSIKLRRRGRVSWRQQGPRGRR